MITVGGALALFLLCTSNVLGQMSESSSAERSPEFRRTGLIESTVIPGFKIDFDNNQKIHKPVCKTRQSCLTLYNEFSEDGSDFLMNRVSFCDCPSGTACDTSNPLKMGGNQYSFCGKVALKKCKPGQLAITTVGIIESVHCICDYNLESYNSAEAFLTPTKDMEVFCRRRSMKYHVKKTKGPKPRVSMKDILEYLEH